RRVIARLGDVEPHVGEAVAEVVPRLEHHADAEGAVDGVLVVVAGVVPAAGGDLAPVAETHQVAEGVVPVTCGVCEGDAVVLPGDCGATAPEVKAAGGGVESEVVNVGSDAERWRAADAGD